MKWNTTNLDETGKENDASRENFKENVIENIPLERNRIIKPIGNINKRIGQSAINVIKNKKAQERNKIMKRKTKNKMARKSRRKNRK